MDREQMTPQERREYIANNILGWKILPKGKGDGEFYVMTLWAYDNGRIIKMPKKAVIVEELPDFESLPEWVSPLCEEIFPMLAKKNWHISFLNNGHVSLNDSEGWEILGIRTGPLAMVLVDAHIKITEEKQYEETKNKSH
ncbi:hypothetical protein LEP1GSC096_0053 [Leptospira interrogans serovar Hebdomadis str. R499]|uniref:hypothetical protein n=1 Tax=Leptospira interrogans TaxID=173 RepID=UPI0002980E7B|nr:hypothetical protein [Leptospira interrogans]EKR34406.1 hypothetical protein LEP1GSC096_0053 [Leptospira interrogans serovar Hebdomadis str. R499]